MSQVKKVVEEEAQAKARTESSSTVSTDEDVKEIRALNNEVRKARANESLTHILVGGESTHGKEATRNRKAAEFKATGALDPFDSSDSEQEKPEAPAQTEEEKKAAKRRERKKEKSTTAQEELRSTLMDG